MQKPRFNPFTYFPDVQASPAEPGGAVGGRSSLFVERSGGNSRNDGYKWVTADLALCSASLGNAIPMVPWIFSHKPTALKRWSGIYPVDTLSSACHPLVFWRSGGAMGGCFYIKLSSVNELAKIHGQCIYSTSTSLLSNEWRPGIVV